MSNYFGTGDLGDVTIAGNYSVPSDLDGDVVVLNYKNLTINEGATLTTLHRCRGLVIYVQGNCIVNGRITMHHKGCHANPDDTSVTTDTPRLPSDGSPVGDNGIIISRISTTIGTESGPSEVAGCGTALVTSEQNQQELISNGVKFQNKKIGAAGGLGGILGWSLPNQYPGKPGLTLDKCTGGGGGGAGGRFQEHGSYSGWDGVAGTCFSGGPGGAPGKTIYPYNPFGPGIPGNYGGNGGWTMTSWTLGWGGCGNHATLETDNCFGGGGTGGFLALIVNGDIILGPNGIIDSVGSTPIAKDLTKPIATAPYGCSGSGGGALCIMYGGDLIQNLVSSIISVSGGGCGTFREVGYFHSDPASGAVGGDGTLQIYNIDKSNSNIIEGSSDCLVINSNEDIVIAKIAIRIPYESAYPKICRFTVGPSDNPDRFGWFTTRIKEEIAINGEWIDFNYSPEMLQKQYAYFTADELPLCIVAHTTGAEIMPYSNFELSVFYDEVKYT